MRKDVREMAGCGGGGDGKGSASGGIVHTRPGQRTTVCVAQSKTVKVQIPSSISDIRSGNSDTDSSTGGSAMNSDIRTKILTFDWPSET